MPSQAARGKLRRSGHRLHAAAGKHVVEEAQGSRRVTKPLVAITSWLSRRKGVPSKRTMAPPASVTSSAPAAVSHGIQIEFPIALDPARGTIGQVERRRAGTANAVRSQSQLLVEVNIGIGMALVAGKAGGQQALRQVLDFGDVQAAGRFRSSAAATLPCPFPLQRARRGSDRRQRRRPIRHPGR